MVFKLYGKTVIWIRPVTFAPNGFDGVESMIPKFPLRYIESLNDVLSYYKFGGVS